MINLAAAILYVLILGKLVVWSYRKALNHESLQPYDDLTRRMIAMWFTLLVVALYTGLVYVIIRVLLHFGLYPG
jgi:hypothetical protein